MRRTTTETPGDRVVEASSSSTSVGHRMQEPGDQAGPRDAPAVRPGRSRATHVDRDEPCGIAPTDKVVGLTRAGAAALLRVSSSTVRRLEERGVLHPRVVDGVHFFDPVEIHRARAERASCAPTDGEAAALAFELLDQGAGLREIVKRCRVTPERARVLATDWKKMGSGELVISGEIRAEISRVLGVRLLSSDALLRAVRDIVLERDMLEREFAEMQEQRNAAEDLLGSEQLRELYAARERARSSAAADPPGGSTSRSTTTR
jgi:hypothetical protein